MRRAPLVVVLLAVTACAAAMRRTAPPPLPDCALPFAPSAHLNLEDPRDRQQLADELERVDVIASRFRERIRSDTAVAPTVHARVTHATRPDRAYRYCETILREELVKAHAIRPEDLPMPAESDRAQR